tara:strand:+ start:261 stop:368 length:108 start_codon:yes stop_codon:yes gene_type:complete
MVGADVVMVERADVVGTGVVTVEVHVVMESNPAPA